MVQSSLFVSNMGVAVSSWASQGYGGRITGWFAAIFVGCGGAAEFARRASGCDGRFGGKATPGRASDAVVRSVFRANALNSSAQQPFPVDAEPAGVFSVSCVRRN